MDNLDELLQFFKYDHLTSKVLRDASKPFHALATQIVINTPSNPQRTRALEKLIEAKDCAVRAMFMVERQEPGA